MTRPARLKNRPAARAFFVRLAGSYYRELSRPTGCTRGAQTGRVTMNDAGVTRVAVYIDFDNIVISRYDQVHGRGQFQRDKVRAFDRTDKAADAEIVDK